ncbi:hypothetical protein FO519_003787, partial [Halicephalobus sp. NKZ332]
MFPFNRSKNFRASYVREQNSESFTLQDGEISNVPDRAAPIFSDTESHLLIDGGAPKPTPLSQEERSFMANAIRLSIPDVRWRYRFGATSEEDSLNFTEISNNTHSITDGWWPALTILRMMGFFCGLIKTRRRRNFKDNLVHIFLILISICVLGFNIHIYRHNVLISILYNSKFGFLHGATVSNLISGIKPFINAVMITIFIWRLPKHKKMLKNMDTVDFCFRIFEVRILDGSFKDEIFSFFVVPLLTAWNVLPLMYYFLCNRMVRFWCRVLRKSLKKEHSKRTFSLKFYYQQFLRVTAVQETIGNTFNPFVLFSLAWSLLLLCLTIYFMTQPKSSFTEPITHIQLHNETLRNILNHRFFVNSGWALIQIIVAILHIVVICWTGMTTNEE